MSSTSEILTLPELLTELVNETIRKTQSNIEESRRETADVLEQFREVTESANRGRVIVNRSWPVEHFILYRLRKSMTYTAGRA